jgi:hypothetical protein
MGAASIAVTNAQAGYRPGSADAPQPYRPFLSHDHLCAVCASISLLGASVLPHVQTLALPCAVVAVRELDLLCRTAPPRELRSSAQARAPPPA